MNKVEVRKDALNTRRLLAPDEVQSFSRLVEESVLGLPEYRRARVIASYVAKKDEVQTAEILRLALASGKRVIVPRSDPRSLALDFHEILNLEELRLGTFGVLEPATNSRIVPIAASDLILVPVVAWDSRGNRVGYGKGYFDRALKEKGGASCAGLAFEIQFRDPLPITSTDVPLDMVITEKRVVRFSRDLHG